MRCPAGPGSGLRPIGLVTSSGIRNDMISLCFIRLDREIQYNPDTVFWGKSSSFTGRSKYCLEIV